ncbi:MAG: aspartate ammonia-lyase [Candidatus Diapherotrites archaeon]|nr:aspartate ammonia-lyase [Candidatus Diapherotrites archaeon]
MKRSRKGKKTRVERDALGPKRVPAKAEYGIFTQRALENFELSGETFPQIFIYSLALIKHASARTNYALKKLGARAFHAIERACLKVEKGALGKEFVLDPFEAGAGTPVNMNVNEVLANQANEALGKPKGRYKPVHPNDHVNMGQSSNDVIPSGIKIACLFLWKELKKETHGLSRALEGQAKKLRKIQKVGRTHLQDAVPITLGEEFHAYSVSIARAQKELERAARDLEELSLGGTAIGTGLNAPKGFDKRVIKELTRLTKIKLRPSREKIYLTQNMRAFVEWADALESLAIDVHKICDDFILLSSGPRAGFGELILPAVEPGSSIMPGKVNPSIPEAVRMACVQVRAHAEAVRMSAGEGQLELNVMTPLIAYNLFKAMHLLENALRALNEKCVKGIQADRKRIQEMEENSLIHSTKLVPLLGYDTVARLVHKAVKEGKSLRAVLLEEKALDEGRIEKILGRGK